MPDSISYLDRRGYKTSPALAKFVRVETEAGLVAFSDPSIFGGPGSGPHPGQIRSLGDRSGTVARMVNVEKEVHPVYHLANLDKADFDQKALAKYQAQYEKKGEAGWHDLPFLSKGSDGKLVVDDGSHRFFAAQLAGAKQVMARVEEDVVKPKN